MSTYNDENESRPAQGGWYSDDQDAVKPEDDSSSQPADDGSYRIASPKQDSYYQDANYTPQSEATAPQSYYVPNSRDNGGKKEKEKKKGGFTFGQGRGPLPLLRAAGRRGRRRAGVRLLP